MSMDDLESMIHTAQAEGYQRGFDDGVRAERAQAAKAADITAAEDQARNDAKNATFGRAN